MIKIDIDIYIYIYICIYCFVTCSSQLIHKRNHITIYTISRDLRFCKIGFKALNKKKLYNLLICRKELNTATVISLKDFERKVLIGAWGEREWRGLWFNAFVSLNFIQKSWQKFKPKILLTIFFIYILEWVGSCFTETEINEKM